MQSKLLYTLENHMTDKVRPVCDAAINSRNYAYLRDIFEAFDERLSFSGSVHGITSPRCLQKAANSYLLAHIKSRLNCFENRL